MKFAQNSNTVFDRATADYHVSDHVDAPHPNPYDEGTIDHTLYAKNMIDAVQWHLEDIIRDPEIDPVEALALKRRIDRSNQERTDMVEEIDTYFRELYSGVKPEKNATINTESPAWALDRLSILALKIYHMKAEVARTDAMPEHTATAAGRPHSGHRHPVGRHISRTQVHEGIPPDENVQRSRHKSNPIWAKISPI